MGDWMRERKQRKDKRVAFERAIEARLMAIDGTWQRPCKIHDITEIGAKLVIDGAVTDIGQKEFFLVLSPMGWPTGIARSHGSTVSSGACNYSTGAELPRKHDARRNLRQIALARF